MLKNNLLNIIQAQKTLIKVIIIAFVWMTNACFAQNSLQDSLQNQFTAYHQNNLQEKIFLHTDKEFYLCDEILWFKTYNVDAFFHKPLNISKVAYVELLDKNNKSVLKTKLALKDGFGNGSLQLPHFIGSGNYKIRAYTHWMKNFNANYFFEKKLTIINSKKAYEGDSLHQKNQIEVAFFPEGGNLVNGLSSKIAFHVLKNNTGQSCNGVIINTKSDTVVKFSTHKFGIGNFTLTPESGQAYQAIIWLNDSTKIKQNLPIAYVNGTVMHLEEANNQQLKVRVETTNLSNVYLFVHTRGIIKSVQNAKIQHGNATFLIEKAKIGDGISHFTIFNDQKHPLCERLYFKYPEPLNLILSSEKSIYETRKKISLNIRATNQDEKPIQANLSMSVYKIDSLQTICDEDINSYFWLSSDLVGKIESPTYYFSAENGTHEAIDNLMLTHGWRRFRWENIISIKKSSFEFMPEYVGHVITGKITHPRTDIPAQNIEAFLSVASNRTLFRPAKSDTNGIVKFEIKDFYTNNEIILQTDSLYDVEIMNPFSEKYTTNLLPNFSQNQINLRELINHHVGVQVQSVYANNKLKQFIAPIIDTSAFYSKPDETYLLDNYVRFATVDEVLREYVKPVIVRKRNGKSHFLVYDLLKNKFFEDDPLVLLDGVPIFDIDKFITHNPSKIKKLEIVSRQYYLGKKSFSGILNFTTYQGNLANFELDPNTTVIDYEGLQKQRDFYSPIYQNQQQVASRMPDFRNVLYWSPILKTDQNGKQEVNFYSSDLTGKFVIILQGITKEGKTGSKIAQFDVK
jgi:hypothetical protein